ncbi:MAG: 3'-5' exonuclease [Candidatus Melainabacteria bacterium]|nr:3'-5' exonuclease [Candidatus Melainabacteria bacterium]
MNELRLNPKGFWNTNGWSLAGAFSPIGQKTPVCRFGSAPAVPVGLSAPTPLGTSWETPMGTSWGQDQFERSGLASSSLPENTLPTKADALRFGARRAHPHTKAHHVSSGLAPEDGSAATVDDYNRYNPSNTNSPPSVYHAISAFPTQAQMAELAKVLEAYIQQNGTQRLDIPWVKGRKPFSETPTSVFDFETTGLKLPGLRNPVRVLQYAVAPLGPNLSLDYRAIQAGLCHPGSVAGGEALFPIHPRSTDIHGISMQTLEAAGVTDTFVERLPQLRQRGQQFPLGENRLLAGYNAAQFDRDVANESIALYNLARPQGTRALEPLEQALVVDGLILWNRLHPFNAQKRQLANAYQILMGAPLADQHDAVADVVATVDLLKYTTRYLQQHSIPRAWAEKAEAMLIGHYAQTYFENSAPGKPDANGARSPVGEAASQQQRVAQSLNTAQAQWQRLEPAQKAAQIAQYVHNHRDWFNSPASGVQAQAQDAPLRTIDLLRFQWGSPAYHDGAPGYYPVFDIVLRPFGQNANAFWDGSDTLDADLVRQIRQEREQENRQYLGDLWWESVSKRPELETTLQELGEQLLSQRDQAPRSPARWKEQILDAMVDALETATVDALLDRPLCRPDELAAVQQQWLKVLPERLTTSLNNTLQQAVASTGEEGASANEWPSSLQKLRDRLVALSVSQTKPVLEQLATQHFYRALPLDETASLIDPAVKDSVLRAKQLEAQVPADQRNRFLLYQPGEKPPQASVQSVQASTPVAAEKTLSTVPVVDSGLLIQGQWLDKILTETPAWYDLPPSQKRWEIRGTDNHQQVGKTVALIQSDSQTPGQWQVRGTARLESTEPLFYEDDDGQIRLDERYLLNHMDQHHVPPELPLDFVLKVQRDLFREKVQEGRSQIQQRSQMKALRQAMAGLIDFHPGPEPLFFKKIAYQTPYAWKLSDIEILPQPVMMEPKAGAITWVKLPPEVQQRLQAQQLQAQQQEQH